ncbi:MAG TPA: porin family protein [Saprospiraceae bacterium]|nr:porin family protein [Saprospiraceae bacterium]
MQDHLAGLKTGMKVRKPVFTHFALLFLTFIGITGPYTLSAQRFSAALTAGFNASQIDGDDLAGFDKVGLTGGVKAIMLFSTPVTLNMEFLYSERGSRPDVFNPQYDPDVKITLKYAELPVYISYGDWWQEQGKYYKVGIYGGFSYGRLITARTFDYYHSSDQSYDLLVPYFNNNDISWLMGLNYRMSQHWGITGRYTRGITPLLSPAKHNLATKRLLSYFLTFRLEYYFK